MSNRAHTTRTLAPRQTVTLPNALAERRRDQAERLDVSSSLLVREAVKRGIRGAVDATRARLRRIRDASTDATSDRTAES